MTSGRERVLTMNRGSATLKSTLYEVGGNPGKPADVLVSISVSYSHAASARLKITSANGATLLDSSVKGTDSNAALQAMFVWLDKHEYLSGLKAAGHRLVHGGARYTEPQRITPRFLTALEKLVPLDPDHLPAAIKGIKFVAKKFPKLAQVACFDTAFHRSLPTVAKMYALPRRFYDAGVRRYGFHGLSFEYIVGELRKLDAKLAAGRVIIAHLGSGASIVALRDGKSMDTSMGFTPLEGLVMSARSGDLDPGLLLYLLAEKKMSAKEAGVLLNKQSGLLGVSGSTGDMRELLEKAQARPACSRSHRFILLSREKIYRRLRRGARRSRRAHLHRRNRRARSRHSRTHLQRPRFPRNPTRCAAKRSERASNLRHRSRVNVRVIQTNEDLMIVQHVITVLG